MPTFLLLPTFMQRPEFGMHAENTDAMDLFVLATLACLFLMFGFFAGCGWAIWRRTMKPKPHMRLIMELQDEQTPSQEKPATQTPVEKPAPWERDSDWWKK
jgi:hypothetical protein